MDISHRKEQFQVGYIRALASCAGLVSGEWTVDNDCIDITLKGIGYPKPYIRNPGIDIQLKATESLRKVGDCFAYDINIRTYDHLRDKDVSYPQYLMVLHLPKNLSDWIDHNGDGITLKNKCYWVSLKGLPESANKTSVTVHIPENQIVTVDVLRGFVDQASKMRLSA